MENKMISVIIPAYNAEKTIERTLASLISNKDYIREIIMVDDNSTDDTVKQALKFSEHFNNFHIIGSEGWHNPGLARKTGMIHAHGEWITFLDADDCFTPSSLRYVSKQIADSDAVILLCQSIYYESGSFAPETIGHTDISCGGNFYNRQYLFDRELFPHDELTLSEDEYFNDIIFKQIKCDNLEHCIKHFDYPVYQVYHDIDFGQSHAIRNWADYCVKSHLEYKQYVADRFKDTEIRDLIIDEYCNNFIFAYFLFQALLLDKDLDHAEVTNQMIHFKRAISYFENNLSSREYLVNYYNIHEEETEGLWVSAMDCTGIEFDEYLQFDEFVEDL